MATHRYQLTASLSVLWRPDGSLQVGLDSERSVLLPGAPVAADAALRALRAPRTRLEVLRLVPGASTDWLDHALAALGRAGIVARVDAIPVPAVTIAGTGVLARTVAEVVRSTGARVTTAPHATPEAVNGSVTIVCPETVEPDRVALRDLTASGQPHLVVRAEPERAVAGPFVPAAGGSCVNCTDLVRRDVDRDWPHLLAQLCRMRHTPSAAQAGWLAAVSVAQVAAWRSGRAPDTTGATFELDAETGAFGTRRWPPHPDCECSLADAPYRWAWSTESTPSP